LPLESVHVEPVDGAVAKLNCRPEVTIDGDGEGEGAPAPTFTDIPRPTDIPGPITIAILSYLRTFA